MLLDHLENLLQSIEPAAHLVEPRVLRRVIRIDRRLQGFRLVIPHESCYTIDRDRLLAFVELNELSVEPGSDLPRRLILLPQPDDDELANEANRPALLLRYRRALYHACVHLELENRHLRNQPDESWAAERRTHIGEVEFNEIREVLTKEGQLFYAPTDIETYIEFAAIALELAHFAPRDLSNYFPAIRDWDAVFRILKQDVNGDYLFHRLQFSGSSDREGGARAESTGSASDSQSQESRVSQEAFRKMQSKAAQAAKVGNSIKAALAHYRMARVAPDHNLESEALAASDHELAGFTHRWRRILRLSEDDEKEWLSSLKPLVAPAAEGLRSNEARLLRDLQKVCIEQERGIYRLDLIGWIRSLGKRPVRRPLPLMQDVLTLRHLRTARRRMALTRIASEEQSNLLRLIDRVTGQVEARSRERMRGIIDQVLDDIGFKPSNVLEIIARRKLVEELLDRIVDQSYLTMTDLRDAISKNDLKLGDVTQLSELVTGDYLLQADRRFDTALDGVYRRGAIYLRGPQMISSLVFGTNVGRILTKRVFIPFGGAYLLLEFLHHFLFVGIGTSSHGPPSNNADNMTGTGEALIETGSQLTNAFVPIVKNAPVNAEPQWMFWSGVVLLGTWLSLLIHRPEFRAWNLAVVRDVWRLLRHVVVELPSDFFNSEWVQSVLESRGFAIVRSYCLEPGASAALIAMAAWLLGWPQSARTVFEVFLVTALFLNSPVGRYVSERTFDFVMRAWLELKMQIFSAIVRAIVDVFDRLAGWLSRIVYTVDDWLRFRAGDNQLMQGIKLAGGVVWFFVSYVIVFVFTLLVEPQINPIKHFPVVTVSHKLILPAGPMVVRELTPYLGIAQANTLVWTTIWLIPGVFGFLVWELKENWRLYAANRSQRLGPQAIGHHGETMLRLLRPGFHSGTLPKAFASLRRPPRKDSGWAEGRIQRKRAVVANAEEAVLHFVEREFVALLEEVDFPESACLAVGPVRAATNRIDVALRCGGPPHGMQEPNSPFSPNSGRLTWEYHDNQLNGEFMPPAWLDTLNETDRRTFLSALEKLFQRSGVNSIGGPLRLSASPHRNWHDAVAYWDASPPGFADDQLP